MFSEDGAQINEVSSASQKGPAVYSVQELNSQIKRSLETAYQLVWVRGDISGFKPHSSGHFYFQLKDSASSIKAVMFRGFNSRLKFKPQDGLEVLVRAKVTVYEPRGDYQLNVEMMEPVGAGALQKAFEQLKEKLMAEGLFASERKRALPSYPRKIAVVTSPTGAVIQDILNVMGRRDRGMHLVVVPTLVQGATAAPLIVDAIKKAGRIPGVEVLIVARGGGSMEDLWCFNDEAVARAIAASPVPVVSAVGHEVDFTIADFVADLRAPTPSAAAEIVTKNQVELFERLRVLQRRIEVGIRQIAKAKTFALRSLLSRLKDPRQRLQDLMQRNDELAERLRFAAQKRIEALRSRVLLLESRLPHPRTCIEAGRSRLTLALQRMVRGQFRRTERAKARLQEQGLLLDSLSPLRVLGRGYSIAFHGDEKVVRSVRQVSAGESLRTRVQDGWIQSKVTQVEEGAWQIEK